MLEMRWFLSLAATLLAASTLVQAAQLPSDAAQAKVAQCMMAAVEIAVRTHFDLETADNLFDQTCKAERAAYKRVLLAEADPKLSRSHNEKVVDAVVAFSSFYAKQEFRKLTGNPTDK